MPLLLAGFVADRHAATATSLLIRAAAGDMYVAARRARGISYVLSGAVVGAVLGPAVFSPMFADRKLDAADADGAVARRPRASRSSRSSIVLLVRPGHAGDRRSS